MRDLVYERFGKIEKSMDAQKQALAENPDDSWKTFDQMESAVKQVGRRVKASEKFRSALGGAGILALRGKLSVQALNRLVIQDVEKKDP